MPIEIAKQITPNYNRSPQSMNWNGLKSLKQLLPTNTLEISSNWRADFGQTAKQVPTVDLLEAVWVWQLAVNERKN